MKDLEIEGMAELLESEEAEEQALKRQMAESEVGPKVKMARMNPTSEKHGADEFVEKEKAKVPRLDLSGSPSASSAGALASNWSEGFFPLCCLGKIPGGAPFSQLH